MDLFFALSKKLVSLYSDQESSTVAPSAGFTPSAKSISPVRSAFKRAELSGIERKTTLSSFGSPSAQ